MRLIVGISGASGAPLAILLLSALKEKDVETHLVITEGGVLAQAIWPGADQNN
jgi:4-hydroxy-3-polyprenylbenzoate decarboxylase